MVDVSLADGPWTQSDVTFNTLPQISNPPLASAAVYGANVWYSWDVTAAVVRKVSPLATSTPLWSIVVGLLVSISIGLFFGIYPAYQAARLDPVDALRYE